MMNYFLRSVGFQLSIYAGELLLGAVGIRGCNELLNDRDIANPGYYAVSHATGLSGHTEYVKYADGSRDVKRYFGLGHRLWSSELDQDTDGDGLVDKIRESGSEFMMHRLGDVLVRKYDYAEYKERFEEADMQMHELMEKYDR